MCCGSAPVSLWRSLSIAAASSAGSDPVTRRDSQVVRGGRARRSRRSACRPCASRSRRGQRAQRVGREVRDRRPCRVSRIGAPIGAAPQAGAAIPEAQSSSLDQADRGGALDAPGRREHGERDAGGVGDRVEPGDAGRVLGRERGKAEILRSACGCSSWTTIAAPGPPAPRRHAASRPGSTRRRRSRPARPGPPRSPRGVVSQAAATRLNIRRRLNSDGPSHAPEPGIDPRFRQ